MQKQRMLQRNFYLSAVTIFIPIQERNCYIRATCTSNCARETIYATNFMVPVIKHRPGRLIDVSQAGR